MTAVLASFTTLLGLVIGSFLNVVVYRVPRGESVIRPRSHCPGCGASVRPRDEMPVVSWLALRGRCRDCGEPISVRYPAVELTTGALFLALTLRFGASPELPAYLYLGAVGIALAIIDLDIKRLPNSLTLPSYALGAALLGLAALVTHDAHSLLRALAGMGCAYAGYFLVAFAYPKGIGFGDVKLAGVLGLYLGWLGWPVLAVGMFAGFFLGGIAGIALMLSGRAGRKSQIPFGPFMITGALLAVFVGAALAHSYTSVTFG